MKQVIIIGGGFAGSYAARTLEKDFAVTLIDNKEHFEFTPSILRSVVEPEHIKQIQLEHKKYLNCDVVFDEVLEIEKNKINTEKGSFSFDYLIIASGSNYNEPIKHANLVLTSRANELKDYAHRLKEAQKVLIIGGGIVGVELAAEIAEKYADKEIILVHSRDQLMNRNHPKCHSRADKFLKKNGVKIRHEEKVIGHENETWITNTGKKIEADIAFLCTGIVPNSKFISEKFLDQKKHVKVNQYLQVNNNIFAAGDVNDVKEEKTAQGAEKQAQIVVKNIYHLEKGEKLEKYVSGKKMMVISLGKKDGILTKGNFNLTGRVTSWLKELIEKKEMRRLI